MLAYVLSIFVRSSPFTPGDTSSSWLERSSTLTHSKFHHSHKFHYDTLTLVFYLKKLYLCRNLMYKLHTFSSEATSIFIIMDSNISFRSSLYFKWVGYTVKNLIVFGISIVNVSFYVILVLHVYRKICRHIS